MDETTKKDIKVCLEGLVQFTVLALIGMGIAVILPVVIACLIGLAIGVGAYFVIYAIVMFFIS